MQKMHMGRKILSCLLTICVVASMTPNMALAADQAGDTVKGDPETISVSGGAFSQRENNFNSDWKFYLGNSSSAQNKDFNDSGWQNIDLPHDFSISQNFTTSGEAESGFLPGGTGWYRKRFSLPKEAGEKRILLEFDGVYSDAYVYVNGTQVGENHYGYNTFAFDITDYVVCDDSTENVLAVKAVNNIPSSRWYSGSGIYRDVTLTITDNLHVDWNGTTVTTPDIESGKGTVKVAANIVNDGTESTKVTVTNTVYKKGGTDVQAQDSQSVTIAGKSTQQVEVSSVVPDPVLWELENPQQYTVVTTVAAGDTVLDTYASDFGFRYYEFSRTTGFALNGKKVKLNGVCLHHDQGALGSAAYDDAMYRQLSKMKDMGVNAIRTSHNPADEDFIDICNELGLLVIEEVFDGWSNAKNGNSNDFSKYFNTSISSGNHTYGGNSSMTWAELVMKNTVKRDRNDPSVIMWSLGNELLEGCSSGGSDYPQIAQKLIDWMKAEDTTRPATVGDNNAKNGNSTYISVCNVIANNGGIVGLNYCSSDQLSSLYSGHSSWKIYSAETSSATNSRGIYVSQNSNTNVDGKMHLTSYDTSTVGWGQTAHDSLYNTMTKDYVAGEFVWTGFDYIGEPTPYNGTGSGSVSGSGAKPNSSYFGIVDTAGFEKDTYYLYRSQWNQKADTLHLVTAWDSDNMYTIGGKTPVVIYSNAAKVELYRNGTLIGTANRTVQTTGAGFRYYTYSTSSNSSNICTAVSGSGSSSLYAAFQVTYAAGTLSAKAYDENGTEVTGDCEGMTSVSTPGTVSKLQITQDKKEIAADGSSLVYISVNVTDASGNLDTTATNSISFALSGKGEIVGVDNGDQATTDKYQQSSVLSGTTSAKISAYAGKALVIVKSTDQEGGFSLKVSSDNLEGGTVTVDTKAASDSGTKGLVSYTMVRDYSVKAGNKPELETKATGIMADGTSVTGEITWDPVSETVYGTAGDYTVAGILSIADQEIAVTCRLHVIADVIAMRNVATATLPGTVPTLPTTVSGLLSDATLSGEFPVVWDSVDADQFQTTGDVVTVKGTATVIGDTTLPVTASVRVAEAVNTESANVAPKSQVTQDIASNKQSDSLDAITNGNTTFQDNTSERWTNWNNRTTSATATLTFTWDTAQLLSSCNLYYYYDSCCAKPEKVEFQYSLDGTNFTTVETTEEQVQSDSLGAEYAYTFEKVINPVAVRLILTQQSGTTGTNCVGLIEAEMMTYAGKLILEGSADLSSLQVDGTDVSDFDSETLDYKASGSQVTAEGKTNMGITILPAVDHVVRIVTLSEDGTATRTYSVTLDDQSCEHKNTKTVDAKEATCTEDGYTGDTVCSDCGRTLQTGKAIAASGHQTEVRNKKAATCTEEGYTGDEVCTICGTVVSKGSVVTRKEHSWNSGVITTEPTTESEGIKTYTCTVCGETKTEKVDKLPSTEKKIAPVCSLKVAKGSSGKIALTAKFENYAEKDQCYEIVGHGFVYIQQNRLGTGNLTVNWAGRTRVNAKNFAADGRFFYSIKPSYASTRYTARAFISYKDEKGNTIYVYSKPLTASYNSLSQ